jgi:hypothetical protein
MINSLSRQTSVFLDQLVAINVPYYEGTILHWQHDAKKKNKSAMDIPFKQKKISRIFTFCIDIRSFYTLDALNSPTGDISPPITVLFQTSNSYIIETPKKIHITISWQIKRCSLQPQNKRNIYDSSGTRPLMMKSLDPISTKSLLLSTASKRSSQGVKPRKRNGDDK